MGAKTFARIASVVFLLVALLHAARLCFGLAFVIGDWAVPRWPSWLGLLVASYLAYQGHRLAK